MTSALWLLAVAMLWLAYEVVVWWRDRRRADTNLRAMVALQRRRERLDSRLGRVAGRVDR